MLTVPKSDDDTRVLIVPCQRETPRTEDAAVIAGEELAGLPFSVAIDYDNLKIQSATDIIDLVDSGLALLGAPLTEPLLERVQKGILISEFTEPQYRDFFLENKSN